MTPCHYCGRRRPTYPVQNENDQIVFVCGECIALRQVRDD